MAIERCHYVESLSPNLEERANVHSQFPACTTEPCRPCICRPLIRSQKPWRSPTPTAFAWNVLPLMPSISVIACCHYDGPPHGSWKATSAPALTVSRTTGYWPISPWRRPSSDSGSPPVLWTSTSSHRLRQACHKVASPLPSS